MPLSMIKYFFLKKKTFFLKASNTLNILQPQYQVVIRDEKKKKKKKKKNQSIALWQQSTLVQCGIIIQPKYEKRWGGITSTTINIVKGSQ